VRWLLDEIIRATRAANNSMINVEALSDAELQVLSDQFVKIRNQRSSSAGKDI
jgi:low affinity Fe/Cu permease